MSKSEIIADTARVAPGSPRVGTPHGPLLLIDTASKPGFVGISSEAHGVRCKAFSEGRRQGEEIYPFLETLLGDAGLSPGSLAAIVVATGPGSFSALRVGLCAAKSLAETAGLPLAGISLFDAAATALSGGTTLILFPASRKEVFAAVYGPDRQPIRSPSVLPLDQWRPEPNRLPDVVLCADASLVGIAAGHPALASCAISSIEMELPALFSAAGEFRFGQLDFNDSIALDALYVRRQDPDGSWVDQPTRAVNLDASSLVTPRTNP